MDNPVLQVKDINIAIKTGNSVKTVLKNGNFEVQRGEIVLILGENGSGKSSIFRSLIRDEDKSVESTRSMFFHGELIDTDEKLDKFRKSIGYARQEDDPDSFFSRSVWNYIYDYAKLSKDFESLSKGEIQGEMNKIYKALECDKYADGDLKGRKLKVCSGGEKRMATLLAALSRTKSDLFIMDEPINNLDAYHARLLNNYLIRLKSGENPPGILVITHCHMFQKVDRVYRLSKGELTQIKDYQPKSCFGHCDKYGFYMEEE